MTNASDDMNQELLSALDNFGKVEIGDKISGEILIVDDGEAIIGIDGTGFEGVLTAKEFSNDRNVDLREQLKRGDKIELIVVKRLNPNKDNGSFLLSRKRIEAQKVWEDLETDFDNKARFDVVVTQTVKNGLLVDVKGLRGFIPASLISTNFVKDLQPYVGQTLNVEISELNKAQNRLVLNHRVVEAETQAKAREEVYSKILPGDTLEGTVRRLTNFGAFVDVGGIDGLVHISEISHEHIAQPSDVLSVDQKVEVKVLNLDKEKNKLSLSIKALQAGPWDKAKEELKVGDVLDGKVKKLTDFGAFVEVLPGIEGLVHVSEISWNHIKVPADVLKENEEVQVKVINFDTDKQRLGLSIKQLTENPNPSNESPKEEIENFEMPEESHGFNLADVVKQDKE
ncbi:30S ribosomal protein S1 [Companilactobacillus sp. RD055328]|uniref:30S ribosomal protein S1 n=1 Tax=Companilactobacillus sp. RD055328 TaxID=2916634 RepID=UPI001FC8931F|nr:30S ribosomal protein S1 [Companilactobacillus sp. RD055328]GKQ42735.1 30S ribosomal protein S1 [Companilactobacillus sp. RD055328]